MSPSSREISGPRPAPLKIHKDSHLIHKQSSSSSSSTTTTTTTSSSSSSTQHHHPVIIYTHSPKIIHTQARDFMALVQKLTGLSKSADGNGNDDSAAAATNNPPPPPSNIPRKDSDTIHAATEDSLSSSENCSIAGDVVRHVGGCSLPSAAAWSPLGFDPPPPPNPFLSEIPLFTPNSFCSPRSTFYRYPESAVFSPSVPNMGGSISPSIMEAMKAFPEY